MFVVELFIDALCFAPLASFILSPCGSLWSSSLMPHLNFLLSIPRHVAATQDRRRPSSRQQQAAAGTSKK
eukprot:4595593-Amphidinium_carterae.1